MKEQIQAAKRARKALEQIRRQLLNPTPDSVNSCAESFREAIRCMEKLQADLHQATPGRRPRYQELRAELSVLRQELSLVSSLLKSAADFYEGWGRLLQSHQDSGIDYSSAGSRQPRPERHKLVVHG